MVNTRSCPSLIQSSKGRPQHAFECSIGFHLHGTLIKADSHEILFTFTLSGSRGRYAQQSFSQPSMGFNFSNHAL